MKLDLTHRNLIFGVVDNIPDVKKTVEVIATVEFWLVDIDI